MFYVHIPVQNVLTPQHVQSVLIINLHYLLIANNAKITILNLEIIAFNASNIAKRVQTVLLA